MPALELELDIETLYLTNTNISEFPECIIKNCHKQAVWIAVLEENHCILYHCIGCKERTDIVGASTPGFEWICAHDIVSRFLKWKRVRG